MKLHPPQPPGRVTRKAKEFEVDIAQLRDAGYTFDAIREALASEGVHVSVSTVRREVLRRALTHTPRAAGSASATPIPTGSASTSQAADSRMRHTTAEDAFLNSSGRDVAEAFARAQITNPLLRGKDSG